MYYRPPRNPRQNAVIAAGVLILMAGVSALIFANLILYHDAFFTEWDDDGEVNWAFEGGPFIAGVLMLVAFGVSLISTYACFRHERFILAIGGPIAMLVAYFSVSLDDWVIMAVGAHMLILSVTSLFLLFYSRSMFEEGGVMDRPSRVAMEGGAMPPGPNGPRG
jgi:uncharacterized membrane protein